MFSAFLRGTVGKRKGGMRREMVRGAGKKKRQVGVREKGRNEEWAEDGKGKKREEYKSRKRGRVRERERA